MRVGRYAAAALVLALAGCSSDDPGTQPEPDPSPTEIPSSGAPSTTAPASPTGSPSSIVQDWRPVPGPVRDTVTRGGGWTLTVKDDGASWSLDGPDSSTGGGESGFRVSDALMDHDWAVVVLQDRTEQQPSRAQVTELATGDTFTIDGSSDVPTTNGGTWALGDGRLLHATVGKGGTYCVAGVDLATRTSTLGWCAPRRHGFNGAQVTPAGDSLLSFDSGHPSCRTLIALDGTDGSPFEGVPECQAWDGLRTDDGAVWSVIPNEHHIEEAHFYARSAGGEADLGPGTAGTLAWCSGAAWFVRDPQREGDPAALMRWSAADGLSVAYQSPGGRAFLDAPRCGGDAITVTAMAERGDEQVTTSLS